MTGLTVLGVRAFAVGIVGGLVFFAGFVAGLALGDAERQREWR